MYSAKIHDYVCDYIDGTMDPETRLSFERMMKSNELLQTFVQKAMSGHHAVKQYARYHSARPDKNGKRSDSPDIKSIMIIVSVLLVSAVYGYLLA